MYALKNPGSLAICVSPLVSLMEDQVEGLPGFFHAAFLHSNMPSGQREKVIEKVLSKKLHVLLVSPEAVCGGMFGILRGKDLPQISFACIDEVHCVSQWSHNFRPCYLQLAKVFEN
jgi:ATP-dependent DNA helicase Q4